MPIPPPLPPKKLAWICLKTHAVLLHCVFVDGCGYTFTVDGQKSWWGVTGSGGRTAKCPPTRTKLNYAWPWQYHLSNVFLGSSWSNEYCVGFFFFLAGRGKKWIPKYVKAFQFKILNSILFTNSKLFKIGYRTDNLCSFCKRESETIRHFFWDCPYSNSFWKCVESYYFGLRKQLVHLTLKEIWIGFLSSECPLLNYLILIGKIYLWSCRRNELLPTINSFIVRINAKYEIEKYTCLKNKNLQKLMDKWTL